jgi:hypothetical protein
MKLLSIRHVGITESPYPEYKKDDLVEAGFSIHSTGTDIINGYELRWSKLQLQTGPLLELVDVEYDVDSPRIHVAVTVDRVRRNRYYYIAPSGHKVQYDTIGGITFEFVEEPKRWRLEDKV